MASLAGFIARAEAHGVDGVYEAAETAAASNGLVAKDLGRLALHLRRIDRPATKVLEAIGSDRLTKAEIAQRTGLSRHHVTELVDDLAGRGRLIPPHKDDTEKRYRRARRGPWKLTRDQQRRLIAGLLEEGVPVRRIIEMAGTTSTTVAAVRNGGSRVADSGPELGSTKRRERVEFALPATSGRLTRTGLDPVTRLGVIFRREIPRGATWGGPKFMEWVRRMGLENFERELLDYRTPEGDELFASIGEIALHFPALYRIQRLDATSGVEDDRPLRELLGVA